MPIFNDPKLKPLRRQLRRNQTDAERLLWRHLRNRQINGVKFFRQYGVDRYILDFYTPQARLGIELDGGQHAEPKVKTQDEERVQFLRQFGIEVLRFWNTDVINNLAGVVGEIQAAVVRNSS